MLVIWKQTPMKSVFRFAKELLLAIGVLTILRKTIVAFLATVQSFMRTLAFPACLALSFVMRDEQNSREMRVTNKF